MQIARTSRNFGTLGLQVYRAPKALAGDTLTLQNIWLACSPYVQGLNPAVREWRRRVFGRVLKSSQKLLIGKRLGIPMQYGQLWLRVFRSNGMIEDLGLASFHVVTTVGAGFVVDAWQNSVELETMKYHGFGSGSTAEGVGNTALVTEFTTEYATDNTRPTGTTAEGASANIFSTVATFTPNEAASVEEHGLFDQAANSGGVLFDRSLTGTVSLNGSGDALQATYQWTLSTGG